MGADEVSIDEMSVPDSAWTAWKHSQNVDTGGLCNCGHEGLGSGWHGDDCRGVNFALVTKVQKLMQELYVQWKRAHLDECRAIDPDTGLCPAESDEVFDDKCRWPPPEGLHY